MCFEVEEATSFAPLFQYIGWRCGGERQRGIVSIIDTARHVLFDATNNPNVSVS